MTQTTLARSNRRTQVTFTAEDGTTHAETVFGGGVGAFSKMVDRAVAVLTGWDRLDARVAWDAETDTVTFTHRTTGESRRFATVQS